jgi:hypothetical protein
MVNGLTASTTYTIRVVTIDTSSNRSNPATVQATTAATATYATTGLQMYFDSNTGTAGSNTWTATTGSYTATLTNFNNTTSSGWNNGFLLFDSVNDTASVNLSSNIMGTTSGTIELAFKRNEVSGTGSQTIFDTTNSYYTVSAPSNTSNTLKFYASYNDNGTTKSGSVSSITISPNLLTHFVMVMDTGKVYIYVNGSLTSTLPSTSTSYNVTNWMPLDTQIKLLSYLAKTAPVGMKLIRVYNRALTAQEVSTNYASMGV